MRGRQPCSPGSSSGGRDAPARPCGGAWCSPAVGATLRKRQAPVDDEVKAIAWKAQHRLHARYRTLTAKGKTKQQAVTAVGRELLGFIWAIGVTVEAKGHHAQPAAA